MPIGGGTSILTSFAQPEHTTLYTLFCLGLLDLLLVFLLLMAIVPSHTLGVVVVVKLLPFIQARAAPASAQILTSSHRTHDTGEPCYERSQEKSITELVKNVEKKSETPQMKRSE